MGCGSTKVAQSSTQHVHSGNDFNTSHDHTGSSYTPLSRPVDTSNRFQQSVSENDFSTVTSVSGTSRIRMTLSNDGSFLEVETEELSRQRGADAVPQLGNEDDFERGQSGSGVLGSFSARQDLLRFQARQTVSQTGSKTGSQAGRQRAVHTSLPNLRYHSSEQGTVKPNCTHCSCTAYTAYTGTASGAAPCKDNQTNHSSHDGSSQSHTSRHSSYRSGSSLLPSPLDPVSLLPSPLDPALHLPIPEDLSTQDKTHNSIIKDGVIACSIEPVPVFYLSHGDEITDTPTPPSYHRNSETPTPLSSHISKQSHYPHHFYHTLRPYTHSPMAVHCARCSEANHVRPNRHCHSHRKDNWSPQPPEWSPRDGIMTLGSEPETPGRLTAVHHTVHYRDLLSEQGSLSSGKSGKSASFLFFFLFS